MISERAVYSRGPSPRKTAEIPKELIDFLGKMLGALYLNIIHQEQVPSVTSRLAAMLGFSAESEDIPPNGETRCSGKCSINFFDEFLPERESREERRRRRFPARYNSLHTFGWTSLSSASLQVKVSVYSEPGSGDEADRNDEQILLDSSSDDDDFLPAPPQNQLRDNLLERLQPIRRDERSLENKSFVFMIDLEKCSILKLVEDGIRFVTLGKQLFQIRDHENSTMGPNGVQMYEIDAQPRPHEVFESTFTKDWIKNTCHEQEPRLQVKGRGWFVEEPMFKYNAERVVSTSFLEVIHSPFYDFRLPKCTAPRYSFWLFYDQPLNYEEHLN